MLMINKEYKFKRNWKRDRIRLSKLLRNSKKRSRIKLSNFLMSEMKDGKTKEEMII